MSAEEPRPGGDPPSRTPDGEDHEATGLDLARSIARSLAKAPLRSKSPRRTRPRVDPRVSGTHPDERDPQTLDSTVSRLIREQGWGEDVRVHGVFSRWDAIVGPQVAQHVRPVSFERGDDEAGGRLEVQTDSTAWATQMRLLAATILQRLNAELGEGTVRIIDVKGPNVPSWTKGRRSVRGGRGPRDTYG